VAKKTCNKCTKNLPVDDFRKRKRKLKDGTIVEYHESSCKKCEGKMVNEWQKNKFKALKKKNPLKHRLHLQYQQKYNRKSKNNSITELSDTYIAFVLGMKKKDIVNHPQLIEAKRAQLKLYRKVNPNHKNIKQ